jgi:hypothetical protein
MEHLVDLTPQTRIKAIQESLEFRTSATDTLPSNCARYTVPSKFNWPGVQTFVRHSNLCLAQNWRWSLLALIAGISEVEYDLNLMEFDQILFRKNGNIILRAATESATGQCVVIDMDRLEGKIQQERRHNQTQAVCIMFLGLFVMGLVILMARRG